MFRFLGYLFLLIAISLSGTWLFENNGVIAIDWMDYRIETTIAFAGIMACLLLFIAVITIEVLLWLKKAPRRISSELAVNRNIKGLSLLAEGFAALVDGDSERARDLAKASRKLLPAQPFVLLLSAEAAKGSGDTEGADRYLHAMLKNKATELPALKGLVNSARLEGNLTQAISLAEKARSLKPKSDWTLPVLLDLYKKTGDWESARNVIDSHRGKNPFRKLFKRKLPEDFHARIMREKALASLMLSRKIYNEGDVGLAYKYAKEAYDLEPGFIPAITNLCNVFLALGKRAAAKGLIEKAWEYSPHPELYEIYYKIYPDEKPQKKLKRFKKLIAINPDSSESYKSVALLAMDIDMLEVARENLQAALQKEETKTLLKLMAQLEEKSGADKEIINQLLKKAEYTEDDSWVCESCNSPAAKWDVSCKRCNAYDSITWKRYDKITILGSDRMVTNGGKAA